MPFDCNILRQYATSLPLVRNCDLVKSGMLRLETPFRYPDGSQIDLFLGEAGQGQVFEHYRVSDLGQTVGYLLDLQVKPWATQKRKKILEDICQALDVELDGGELLVRLKDEQLTTDLLPDAMVRVAQACIRMADLAYTQRLRAPVSFRDDVEEFISSNGVEVESGITLRGKFDKEVTVDFRTTGRRVKSLILTLSTQNTAAAHGVSNEVFRKWYDLEPQKGDHQFLTLFDSTNNAVRDDDLARLAEVSTVLAFPAEQDAVMQAIAA
jgi:hypothetical protein